MTISDQSRLRRPTGLGASGRRLWDWVTGSFALEERDLALLVETVRTLDMITKLDAAVRRDGPLVEGPTGQRAHPGLVEVRQQRIVLARLLNELNLPPVDEDGNAARPKRRSKGGSRGVYSIRAS